MNLKELNKVADTNSVSLDLDQDSGIVEVSFKMKGAKMECLYSCAVEGLFGFSILDPETFFNAFRGES